MNPIISDIRIDSEGGWFYRDVEMTRRDIVALFYQHLTQDAAGRYFIEIGQQRYPVNVEDTAYVVWAIHRDIAGECINVLLSDYSLEPLDPATLRIGKECIPYCRVKDGRFNARFSRAGYYQLAEHIEYDPLRDAYFLSVKGKQYYIRQSA
jgi:uncharacterized protein